MIEAPRLQLADGHALPAIGLGTLKLLGVDGIASMIAATGIGYRLLDTALNYKNEREVGEAVRGCGLRRDEVIVTSKLPGRFHGYDETMRGFDETMSNLGLDALDLYLIHWPNPSVDKYVDSWRAMVALRDAGRIRSIGTSNFTPEHIKRVQDATGATPVVNQIELHPYFPQEAQRHFHRENGIVTESWSPLARGNELLAEPVIMGIAGAHGKSPAQVVLRWHTQLDSIPIPKASGLERQRENIDIFDFTLTEQEVARISGLERGRLWDFDPNTHEEL
jgi:2,5-diketo-D-gluconate reductase A